MCGDLGVRPREILRPARADRHAGPDPRKSQRDGAADAAAAAGDDHPPAIEFKGHVLILPLRRT